MMRHNDGRGLTLRKALLTGSLALVVLGAGGTGWVYYRMHTPEHLTKRAALALEQGDADKAISYLQEAMAHPSKDQHVTEVGRLMLARAYLRVGREDDARGQIHAALAANHDDDEALGLLMESYLSTPLRKQRMALQPMAFEAAIDVLTATDAGIAGAEKAAEEHPKSARPLVARAQLRHLRYQVQDEQVRNARAALNRKDAMGQTAALKHLDALKARPAEAYRDGALADLRAAVRMDPGNEPARHLLAQYYLEDKQFAAVREIVRQMFEAQQWSDNVVMIGANAILQDARSDPRLADRLAKAQALLEEYLVKQPRSARTMVALGQVVLERGDVAKAEGLAGQALAILPGDLDAAILQVNCRVRQRKPDEALALITPLTNSHANVPQVWYLLGQANSEAGNYQAAEDAYRKALSIQNVFVSARRGLFLNYVRSGSMDAAGRAAPVLLKDDPYYMPAWSVYADAMRRTGQQEAVDGQLRQLTEDGNFPVESRPELARLLIQEGMYGDAEKMLGAIERDNGTDETVLLLRASLATAQNRPTEARAYLTQATQKAPHSAEARLDYAEYLLANNLQQDARAQLAEADKTATEPDQWLRVAAGYLALRMPAEATAAAQKALDRQPKNLLALQTIAQAKGLAANTRPGDVAGQVPLDASLTAADLARLARLALEQKDYDRALQAARAGLAKDPANVALRLIHARVQFAKGAPEAAVNEVALAAKQSPQELAPYDTFVAMFAQDKETAAKGMDQADKLTPYNACYAAWAKGRLALAAEKPNTAIDAFNDGLDKDARAANRLQARELLYNGLLQAYIAKNDDAGYQKLIARIASEKSLAAMARLAAADRYLSLRNPEAAKEQLTLLEKDQPLAGQPARVVLAAAARWLSAGDAARAIALAEGLPERDKHEPGALGFLAAAYQQAGKPEQALPWMQELAKADSQNPAVLVSLAQLQANLGRFGEAFASLKRASTLGQTGAAMAAAARVRLYSSLGLLQAAGAEIEASSKAAQAGDYQTVLALGQSWAQLHKPIEARQQLEAVPGYAAEYPTAQVTLAQLDIEDGKLEEAIGRLKKLRETAPAAATFPLYQALMRADRVTEALDMTLTLRQRTTPGSAAWNNLTVLAATAARDAREPDKALALLAELRTKNGNQASVDVALLQLAQDKPVDATSVAAASDRAPEFMQTTLKLLATPDGAAANRALAEHQKDMPTAHASFVLAVLADTEPGRWKELAAGPLKNVRAFHGDMELLVEQLGGHPRAKELMGRLALAQRLLESGWATPALDVLEPVRKAAPDVAFVLILRQDAYGQLHRTEAQKANREALLKKWPDLPTSRLLAAQAYLAENKDDEALRAMRALAETEPSRPDLLTSLGQVYERRGELEPAIALNRQVRQAFPEDVSAANNLAYLLLLAKPEDAAARAEARGLIDWAMNKAPHNPALLDTRGYLNLLGNDANAAVGDLSRAIVALRLQPAVHYHLGLAYAKTGQVELARLHLANVAALVPPGQRVPEAALAAEALKQLPAGDKGGQFAGPEARQ